MENQFNYFYNPIRLKILQLTGVVLRLLGFIFVGAFLSQLLLSVFTGTNLTDSERMIFEMEGETGTRFFLLQMQALNAIFVYFVLPILYVFFFQKNLKPIFVIRKKRLGSFILISLFIFLTALPFISQLIEFNQQIQLPEKLSALQEVILRMEERAQKVTDLIVLYDFWYEIIPILFVIAVLAGVGEELLFRGVIQNEIYGIFKNPHVAIWISAVLFSFIHFQFQGFLPRVVLGGLLGYLYYWSGSLLVPIFIHFVNNVLTFALINYVVRQDETILNTSTSLGITVISIIICIVLIIACYRLSLKVKMMSYEKIDY
ncbi:type II CAAX endopeptidase family protein [Cyclobacterium sp.]|uniref:CPBP family intramembrane glutamic endopeptidase n=1 Tax=Cyclobacterium sp. TaxID=1966343 RepID=UPI0019BCB2D7|nr:type II CAAX endopeptidase family protein [Cyclobacterium sp.]MBD3630368.1 CPBP family intramembrane metalloprotease [Cyclobacterium sp.]